MSDYDHETTAATDMLCEACALDGMWTRAERLAEAQVHATLAVAAATMAVGKAGRMQVETAYRINARRVRLGTIGQAPDAYTGSSQDDLAAQLVEAKNSAEGYAATADDLLRLLLPIFTDAEAREFDRSGALPTRDLAAGRPFDPTHIDTQAGFPGRIARNVKAVGFPTHREGPDETEAEFAARLERINIMNANYFIGSERADEVTA